MHHLRKSTGLIFAERVDLRRASSAPAIWGIWGPGFGFGAAVDPVAPAALDQHVKRRALDAFVTSCADQRMPGLSGADLVGLTSRYPVERWPPFWALPTAHDGRVDFGGRHTMDLVNGVPRSPYESMHGIVFLPRAIDKVRAEIAGQLGDYISRTFFSGMLLEFLGIEPQDFVDAVAARERATRRSGPGSRRGCGRGRPPRSWPSTAR